MITAIAVVMSGCTSAADTTGSTNDSVGPAWFVETLQIEDNLDLACSGTTTDGPPPNFAVIGDAVALPTSPDHAALQTSRRDSPNGEKYFFAKTGLSWNTTATFELVVPENFRSVLAIGWGSPAPAAHLVAVTCDGPDQWVAPPGGYWVTEPMCADLTVRATDTEQTVQIGLGTPCPEQEPPEGPSDN